MSPTNPRQTLLAVNSTEWLNLCARGSIRLSKRRPVLTSNPASDREMEKVFASAPFTKLDSSVDLFVIVIKDDWPNSKKRHRTGSSEIFLLNLSDVSKHHPVAQQHVDYYGPMASKFGVQLEEPIFEKPWLYWITNETIQDSCDAAELLQNNFKVNSSTNTKRVDKYKWSDIARLVLRPNEKIKTKPAPIESLLSNIRKIADAVSSARDSEQFYLACAIEWIDVRLNKDPLQKKGCKKVLLDALSNAKERPLGTPSEQTITALQLLVDTFPKAFTSEISPITIAHVVQLLTDSRTRELKLETVVRIINSLDRTSAAATLITFVLSTSLGIELTSQLIRALDHMDFVEINWDGLN